MVKVSRIDPNSIAEELGIQPGSELLTVNGRPLGDFLDWEFLTADEELVIEARQPDGEQVIYELERLDGEPLGISLEPPAVRRCANRCEFCFIEGLPPGLRKPGGRPSMKQNSHRLAQRLTAGGSSEMPSGSPSRRSSS